MIVGFDTETHLIAFNSIAPKLVCASFCTEEQNWLIGNKDRQALKAEIKKHLEENEIVGHNIAFDLVVVVNEFPDLMPIVFSALEKGSIHDTMLREKLHNLGTHGHMDFKEMPDGSNIKIRYSLNELEKNYLGIDRSADKSGEDIWRLNYATLDGIDVEQYPEKAVEYALEDAKNTLSIFLLQKDNRNLCVESLQVKTSFCLFMMTLVGWKIDPVAVEEVKKEVDKELSASKQAPLVDAGILRPSEPPRPHKRGTGWTKGKPVSVNRAVLVERVQSVSEENSIELKYTTKGAISTDKEVLTNLAAYDDVLFAYQRRQNIAKIASTYLPKFYWNDEIADRVHPNFNVLVESGRTSSYGSKLYPSCNIQQVDPRVRKCFIADPGHILISCDYSALELCSLAWKLKNLFGKSKLHDLLMEGKDPHCYLGASLALELDTNFKEAAEGLSKDQIYDLFVSMKSSDKEEVRAFFKNYRTFAKPTGLGLPGGLGAKTFISYAKTTYGVDIKKIADGLAVLPVVDIAEELKEDSALVLATHIKELWFSAYPEMRDYFEWISSKVDSRDKYSYETPLGMVRRGASFCAASNGAALQSPSAEGFKEACWRVVRACWDESVGDMLFGSIPLAPIHDEIIIEVEDNSQRADKAEQLAAIMEESMRHILPGVITRAEPCLMYRWKKADGVYDKKGKLIPIEEA